MTQLVVKISLDPSHAEQRSCGPPLATMPILSAPRASRTRELALLRNRAPSSSERNGEAARRAPGRSENAWYQGEEHHRRCTVHATSPASLDSAALSRRLSQLAGSEREVQVEFLLHLAEYDLRRAYLEAGFGSIWDYVTRFLHYREGAAQRRIKGARVLRRLPLLAEALRDGTLCMSTVALLDPLLTEENAAELVARAAFKTKAEVEYLVVSLQPRDAPKDGVRKLSERRDMASAAALPLAPRPPEVELARGRARRRGGHGRCSWRRGRPFRSAARREPAHRPPGGGGHLLAPSHDRRCPQARHRPAHRAPLPQSAEWRSGSRAARGGSLRHRAAWQAEWRRRARPRADEEVARGSPDRHREACQGPRADRGRGSAAGLEARRGFLRVDRRGRPALREQVEARAGPHPPGGARRPLDRREHSPVVQRAQQPSRGANVRARAHGAVPPQAQSGRFTFASGSRDAGASE